MTPTRRGFFRAILALPFAPKCIQAFRRKPCVHTKAINAYACGRCGKRWDECFPENFTRATGNIRKAIGIYDPSMPGPPTSGVAIMAKFREYERMANIAEAERRRDWDADLKFIEGDQWNRERVTVTDWHIVERNGNLNMLGPKVKTVIGKYQINPEKR